MEIKKKDNGMYILLGIVVASIITAVIAKSFLVGSIVLFVGLLIIAFEHFSKMTPEELSRWWKGEQ